MMGAAVATPPTLSVNPMSTHPLNLVLRFVLELAALAGMGIWGWQQGNGAMAYVLAIGVPVLAAGIWGTFAVRGDHPRGYVVSAPRDLVRSNRMALEKNTMTGGWNDQATKT
jgi:hypothetical protein